MYVKLKNESQGHALLACVNVYLREQKLSLCFKRVLENFMSEPESDLNPT